MPTACRADRLVVVSRGGMESLYGELAGRYVDIFDLMTPQELAARNARAARQAKAADRSSRRRALSTSELLAAARARLGLGDGARCAIRR